MAMDIAILAIPGLGATETSQILCSCSLLFGVGCIFAGTIVQHFGERMRSMDFAVRFTPSFCNLSLTLLTSVILPATKNEDVYRHYMHTDVFLCTQVSKLRL